jgi:hypothetical protein
MKTDPRHRRILAIATCLAWSAAPATAHHSTAAEFDQNKPVTFTGTVTKVQWLNPHIYTIVTVKPEAGAPVAWHVEGGSPNSLYRSGWRKDSLKVGDVVNVKGWRAKNDASPNVGQATITREDGSRVFSGEGPARPAAE